MRKIELDLIFTLLVAMAVYFVGRALVARVPLLRRFSIPAPVVGSGLMAILLAVLTGVFGTTVSFNMSIKDSLLLMFFTTVGLGADVRMRASWRFYSASPRGRNVPRNSAEVVKAEDRDMLWQLEGKTAKWLRACVVGLLTTVWVMTCPSAAHASLLSPEAEDTLAKYLALFVVFFVPVVLIVLFWMVHVLPEKIAHKRHHPQLEAIKTLCLLSLVFGGLLWPLAWLWAFTKPVAHKLAYGTDKHDDYYKEHGLPEPESAAADLRKRLALLEERGVPASELDAIRTDLESIDAGLAGTGVRGEVD